jgi:hypothetical protein
LDSGAALAAQGRNRSKWLMAAYEHRDVLHSLEDGSWSVCRAEDRLVFRNGASAMEIPVEGPLRWSRDGVDMTFASALETVPKELHGWMSLAATIALRHCLGGLMTGVALPAGYHEWPLLAARAEPICAWMHVLARLDGIEVPAMPEGVDDGVSDDLDDHDETVQPAAH